MEWSNTDEKILKKILNLVDTVAREPFSGVGKPEALRHNLKGYWSRRINKEHRLVYRVTNEEIVVIQCKNHY